MNARKWVTLVATVVTAAGAAVLATPTDSQAQNGEFSCGSTGGPPYLGCVPGGAGCWLGGLGPHPDTGEYGCWTAIMSGDNCCKPVNDS